MKLLKPLIFCASLTLLQACQSDTKLVGQTHMQAQQSVALVEQMIRAGMHRNQIVSTLGAPKVIQNGARPGERDKEIWLFDIKVRDIRYVKNKRGQEEVRLKFLSDPYADVPQKTGTIEVKFNRKGLAESIIYTVKSF